jgi:adenine deaminase
MEYSVIAAALGKNTGDLLLKNGQMVNVFNGQIEKKDLLIKDGMIACCECCIKDQAKKVVDLQGKFILPGFIDAHVHIESSHLSPAAFGNAILEKGTTTVIADPHEIANAAGVEGITFMTENAKEAPIDIFFMVPSSVPATTMETAGATIDAQTVKTILKLHPSFLGLGELMNVPGILDGDPETLAKIEAAENHIIDGHYPMGSGRSLMAYAASGVSSDHESVTAAEAAEKLANGITVFIREGSSAKNLNDLIGLVDDYNHTRFCFCADDIHAEDILAHGDILNCIRKAVRQGLNPIYAVEMATINPANHYRLPHRGAIAPGYIADLVIVNDLTAFDIDSVYKNGKEYESSYQPQETRFGTFILKKKDFRFPAMAENRKARVIKISDGQLITEEQIYTKKELIEHTDLALMCVIERYGKNGNIAYALVEGFGIQKGAIASSVAHDSHNLLILAKDEREFAFAAKTMEQIGGGMIVTENNRVLAKMALPIAGLMTYEDADTVAGQEKDLAKAAKDLGIALTSPFMTLSFLALPVIPHLKLTDKGLFDVTKFDFTSLYLE